MDSIGFRDKFFFGMGRILVTVIVMIRVRIMFNVSTGIMTQARIIWGGWSRALL